MKLDKISIKVGQTELSHDSKFWLIFVLWSLAMFLISPGWFITGLLVFDLVMFTAAYRDDKREQSLDYF